MRNPGLKGGHHLSAREPGLAGQFRAELTPGPVVLVHAPQFPEPLPVHHETAADAAHGLNQARDGLLLDLRTVMVLPPVLELHVPVKAPGHSRRELPAGLPDHVLVELRAAAFLALVRLCPLVGSFAAVVAGPVEHMQSVHGRNHRPVRLHILDQFQVEPVIHPAVGVQFHDVLGATQPRPGIGGGTLSDRLAAVQYLQSGMVLQRRNRPTSIANRDHLGGLAAALQHVDHRVAHEFLVAPRYDHA